MRSATLAIDFGTSNSAAAMAEGTGFRRLPLEDANDTLPTAVFFPADGGPMEIGSRASEALIAGDEGRYMRALKSVLGTPLLHESRLIARKRRSLSAVITEFLAEVKARAEAAAGIRFDHALSGRPVHFHSRSATADAQAEVDLRACYLAAGFESVRFMAEPEAAALTSGAAHQTGEIGLVVDIGGGTSDFTVFRHLESGPEVIASHGIRLGGTDFDSAISLSHAMPRLGQGGELRREMGAGLLPVPQAVFVDLATWAKIPFLYTPETRRMVAGMVKLAVEPKRLQRLSSVLELELGHALAFAVERGKIDANSDAPRAIVDMGMIEPRLGARISPFSMGEALTPARTDLHEAAVRVLDKAGIAPADVAKVVLVGGSSLMHLVTDTMAALCPTARQERAQAFTAVVDGLALALGRD